MRPGKSKKRITKQEAKKLAVELIYSNYEEDEAETSYQALLLLKIIVNKNYSFVAENVERVLENMLLIIRVGEKVGYVNSEYHQASTPYEALTTTTRHTL